MCLVLVQLHEELLIESSLLRRCDERIIHGRLLLRHHGFGRHHGRLSRLLFLLLLLFFFSFRSRSTKVKYIISLLWLFLGFRLLLFLLFSFFFSFRFSGRGNQMSLGGRNQTLRKFIRERNAFTVDEQDVSHDHKFSEIQLTILVQISHREQLLQHGTRKTTLTVITNDDVVRNLMCLVLVQLHEELLIESSLLRRCDERIIHGRLLRLRLLRHHGFGRHHGRLSRLLFLLLLLFFFSFRSRSTKVKYIISLLWLFLFSGRLRSGRGRSRRRTKSKVKYIISLLWLFLGFRLLLFLLFSFFFSFRFSGRGNQMSLGGRNQTLRKFIRERNAFTVDEQDVSHDHKFSEIQLTILVQISHREQLLQHGTRKTTLTVITNDDVVRNLMCLVLVQLHEELLVESSLLR